MISLPLPSPHPQKKVGKENITLNLYLENSFNHPATNKKSGTCAFTFEKYLQHSIIISSIILGLQWINFIQYQQQNIQLSTLLAQVNSFSEGNTTICL
jgi:hypothetical protein